MNTPVHVVCGHCEAVVRVPRDKLSQTPACPQCHQRLLDGQPLNLTSQNFDKHVQRNDLPVVVDVWAPWCGPCKTMAPQFATAAGGMATEARFAKLNSDEAQELAGRLGIRSIPTLILYRQGRELGRQSGVMDSARLMHWIRSTATQ
jgi:thioredoxin 2